MLFHSTVRKELSRHFVATAIVLVTIVMTIILIRTLGQASRGQVNPSEVSLVLGYTILGHLPTLLTMSLFIASVGSLSRMYSDSEMVIWFASGRGLSSFLRPLFQFAWPFLLAIALMATFVWPWTNQQIQDLRERFEKRGDLERVTPGQFQESANGQRVFFVDKQASGSTENNNVFIASNERGKQSVTSARSGRIETIGEERYLMLANGQRLETDPQTQEFKLSEFVEYGTQISGSNIQLDEVPPKAKHVWTLLAKPTPLHLGELGWRLSLGLAAFNLLIISLAVASINPRTGRSGSLFFSMLTFLVYYNLINLCQSWVASGKMNPWVQVLGLHGAVLALALLWLARRHNNWRLWPRRTATVPGGSAA